MILYCGPLFNVFVICFLQACFKFRHSVGAIGGKPNHAYYFIGFYGKYRVGNSLEFWAGRGYCIANVLVAFPVP